jgi:hypothetical protein
LRKCRFVMCARTRLRRSLLPFCGWWPEITMKESSDMGSCIAAAKRHALKTLLSSSSKAWVFQFHFAGPVRHSIVTTVVKLTFCPPHTSSLFWNIYISSDSRKSKCRNYASFEIYPGLCHLEEGTSMMWPVRALGPSQGQTLVQMPIEV